MNDLNQLINNTKKLNGSIITFLNDCKLINDPIPSDYDGILWATTCGPYKLETNDKGALKQIKNEWEYWIRVIDSHIGHNREVLSSVTTIRQIIDCGWRVHDSNLEELKSQINTMFNDVISVLEIELSYSKSNIRDKELNANNLVITINTNSTELVINNPVQLYDNLMKIILESELPESDKNEISELLINAKSEPQDIGKFRKVANWINDKANKISPSLNVVASLMGIIKSLL